MNKFVDAKESFLTIGEKNSPVMFNLVVLVALISVIVHFISPKNQHEKRSLKSSVFFQGLLIIFRFVLTIVPRLGRFTDAGKHSLANGFVFV